MPFFLFARTVRCPSSLSIALVFRAGVCLTAAGCGSTPSAGGGDGGSDAGSDIPATEACTGDTTACLSGTVTLTDFKVKASLASVFLYRVFPHGENKPIAEVPVALDGTFAFSSVPAWGHYYLQAEAVFGTGKNTAGVTSVVGSLAVPASNAKIPITIRPVYLEVLQQTSATTSNALAWASAHLYDPTLGTELTSGTVTLEANGKSVDLVYGSNAGGTNSFYAALPADTPGGSTFTITTSSPAFGSTPLSWNLAGEPATFQGAITSPTSTATANEPLTVTWEAVPMASYSVTELFVQSGAGYSSTYTSAEVNAPDVTTETIPASALSAPGAYLLNESYANATCPATADGCVYNVYTAAVNLTVN